MEKPSPCVEEFYDYREASEYISSLIGYDIDNFRDPETGEYFCFWHVCVDQYGADNGRAFSMYELDGPAIAGRIAALFAEEFGPDASYKSEW